MLWRGSSGAVGDQPAMRALRWDCPWRRLPRSAADGVGRQQGGGGRTYPRAPLAACA
uniref:Uncharacterized protein n=1 Tax=Arundo donax TaxID=35708 RepID=A0A0A9AY22_ARUDO